MSNHNAVQLYDDQAGDRASARYVAFEKPYLSAGQYVILSCPSGRAFLGVIAGPQLNFNRNSLSPVDNTAINQLERIATGQMRREVAVKEVYYYDVQIAKEIVNGRPESVRVRPQIGARARPAEDAEIVDYLGLPKISEETRIGTIIDTSVPICTSLRTTLWHTLVAGGTGSGKTNTIANIITGNLDAGACCIIFDHKPDYQDAHRENDEGEPESHFRAIDDISYWYIGNKLPVVGRTENPISVRADELEPNMLASTIFYRDGEENALETLESLIESFIGMREGRWNIHELVEWITSTPKDKAPGKHHAATYESVQRKIVRTSRVPAWIDNQPKQPLSFNGAFLRGDRLDSNLVNFNVGDLIQPGSAIVVRIGSNVSNGREYGLLLSHILKKVYARAETRTMPCPVLISIDEAQDIFSASASFKRVAAEMLDEKVRKGRSRRIGFLIGVQSADAVPDQIMNNLNSRIIHRHNSHDQVKKAANMATEDQRKMTSTFSAGEALVYLYGSNGIVHAKMRRSPFKLTKEELTDYAAPVTEPHDVLTTIEQNGLVTV